jgi:hypothetical protein
MKVLRPKRPLWLLATVFVGIACLGFFLVFVSRHVWSPAGAAGVAFGGAAAAVAVLQTFYPLRHRLLGFPFGSAQRWLQFHIYGGILGFLFVLIHEGFRRPSGAIGWAMLALSLWAVVSGLVGVWLEKWIPAMIASGLEVVAIFDRIPSLVEKVRTESVALIEGSSEMLQRFYRDDVAPALAGVNVSWDYLLDVQGGRERRLAPFARMAPFLSEAERPRLEDLQTLFTEKLELDAQYSLYRILRVWAAFHAPPSLCLIGLILYHVTTNLYYWWSS